MIQEVMDNLGGWGRAPASPQTRTLRKTGGSLRLDPGHPIRVGLTLVLLLIATTVSAAEESRREKFDRACALAAEGKTDEAREIWRDTALDADKQVAGMSHLNLAGLAVEDAHKALGEDPLQAAAEARVQGLAHLAVAAGHYRDGLDVDPDLADARRNLEIVRLWTKYIQDEWRRLDRQKQREGLDLLAYLDLLAEEQRALQAAAKQQAAATASPRRWQTIYDASKAQRRMREEIQPLKQKIAVALQPAPAANAANASAAPAATRADVERAQRMLAELADKSGASMDAAAKQLTAQRPGDAVGPQGAAVDGFEQIYLATAPFLGLVQKGVAVEEKLVAQSQAIVKPTAKQAGESETPPAPDFADLADRQRFVTDLSKVLPLRAKAELQQMEQTSGKPALLEGETQTPAPAPGADPQQAANLKKSLQAALALSPEIERLTREAADDLEKQDAAAALPKQEEALRLLKEILEQQQQNQQDQQQQDQQQQDQKQDQNQQQNQDQNSKNQKDQQQKSDDQKKQDQDQKDQNKKDQEKQDQQNDSQGEQDQQKEQDKKDGEPKEKDQKKQDQGEEEQKAPQPEEKSAEEKEKEREKAQQPSPPEVKSAGDEKQQAAEEVEQGEKKPLSPDQTAALLQKVRERQQEHRERMKAMEQFLRRSQKVEKDW